MLNSLEEQFAFDDVKLFKEFDVTNFVSNTKATFGNKLERIDVPIKINQYIDYIDKSNNALANVGLDNKMYPILNSYGKDILIVADDMNYLVKDISYEEFQFIDYRVLTSFTKEVQNDLQMILTDSGKSSGIETKYRFNGNLLSDIKKKAISSVNNITDFKRWRSSDSLKYVNLNGEYIVKKLLPFIKSFPDKRLEAIKAGKLIQGEIKKCAQSIKYSLDAIDRMKREKSISESNITYINMCIYNITRTMLELMSFMTFASIRKNDVLVSYAMEANMIYVRLTDAMNINENAFDDTILPLDTQSLGDEFINGEAGAFIDVANNIYQFHMGNINNIIDDKNEVNPLNFEVSQEEYDSTLYTDINEIFTQVGAGLDKIGAKTDDVFIVSDDIVDDAGFDVKLYDRFANTINNIDDVSLYQGTANLAEFGPTDKIMFKRILAEIHDYGSNLSEMAKNCAITKRKIVMLQDRFNDNINGEFTNVDTVMDLKIFLDDLLEQYEDIVRSIVKKFILRLKKLGDILTEVSISGEDQKQDFTIDDSDTTVNYSEMAFESILEDEELDVLNVFESLNTLFYYAKESYLTGYDMVIEAEATPNTTPTVQDNSGETGNQAQPVDNNQGQGFFGKLIGKISEFINNIINKFIEIVDKQGKKNIRWLAENKEELTRRSYNNVTVNILPYENIKPEKILKDIQALNNNLTGLQVTQLSSINNENDVYRVLFSFIEGGINDQSPAKDQIEKYYKVGRGDLTPKPIANGQLKTTVVSTMIPFCENYYGQLKNQISDELKNVASAADSAISKMKTSNQQAATGNDHPDTSNSTNTNNTATPTNNNQAQPVTASADDLVNMISGYLVTEADNNPQQGGTNSKVSSWISKAVKTYSGCVLNALRDRANDYMKVLDILVPKTTNSVNRSGSPIETTSNQQAQATQTAQPIQ